MWVHMIQILMLWVYQKILQWLNLINMPPVSLPVTGPLSLSSISEVIGTYDSENVTVTVLPSLGSRSAEEIVQFVSESEWFI